VIEVMTGIRVVLYNREVNAAISAKVGGSAASPGAAKKYATPTTY
jgi:hypothetical protein